MDADPNAFPDVEAHGTAFKLYGWTKAYVNAIEMAFERMWIRTDTRPTESKYHATPVQCPSDYRSSKEAHRRTPHLDLISTSRVER